MLRIAMWSGPRNISTALMRAWENRADTIVCDEPLYAHYLHHTRISHPGAAEVIAHHPTDWRSVVARLIGPHHGSAKIFYQKQMAHHLLDHIETQWLDQVTSCFLIREPREMLTSLVPFIPQPTLADTGLPQQLRIFRRQADRDGAAPLVLDARDVLTDPQRMLTAMCDRLDVAFDPSMLSWPAGRRSTDGIWARHWYAAVEQSTGFRPYQPKKCEVPAELLGLLNECDAIYRELMQHRLS